MTVSSRVAANLKSLRTMREITAFFPGWQHHNIQDETVDTVGLPFSSEFLARGALCSTLVPTEEPVSFETPDSGIRARRPSGRHGRSFELSSQGAPLAIWRDQYGNGYSTLSVKGSRCDKLELEKCEISPYGYRVNGLQEDSSLKRCLRASRVLRTAGISTEWIVNVMEPNELPYESQSLPQATVRQKLIEQYLKSSPETVSEAATALGKMVFFITTRAMDTGVRIWDLSGKHFEQLSRRPDQAIANTFRTYNLLNPDEPKLDPESKKDVVTYFEEILPRTIGTNYAKLHNLGLWHKYPHFGNITLLGSIVDLDSVQGAALGLGDTNMTRPDEVSDIERILQEFRDSYAVMAGNIFKAKLTRRPLHIEMAEATFYETYSALRENDKSLNPPIILSPVIQNPELSFKNEYFMEALRLHFTEQLGTEYMEKIRSTAVALSRSYIGETAYQVTTPLVFDQLDELLADGMLQYESTDVAVEHTKRLFTHAVQTCASAIANDIRVTVINRLTSELAQDNGQPEIITRAITSSVVDIDNVYVTQKYHESTVDTEILDTYLENLGRERDTDAIAAFLDEISPHSFHQGNKAYIGQVSLPTLLRQITEKPATFELHTMTSDAPDENDTMAWLPPLCIINDNLDAGSTAIPQNHPVTGAVHYLPNQVTKGMAYQALITEKDASGKHHVLLWLPPKAAEIEETIKK